MFDELGPIPTATEVETHPTVSMTERTVTKVAAARLPTKYGEFRLIGYESNEGEEFVVLTRGRFHADKPTLVRIHSQCMTGDVFGSLRCDCGQQLDAAMKMIAREGLGAIVYQQQEGRGIGIINKIRAYNLQDAGADTIEANTLLGLDIDLRRYEQCVEILKDLGIRRVRLMSNNPEKIETLTSGGLEIVERVSLPVQQHRPLIGYLKTKRDQMGHLIDIAEVFS
jgi:3,4-dihydroxy 2-butanone 4-phosphate synthase/GTP cyclohydrolase II